MLIRIWHRHWPEYAIEAAGLGAFMVSACGFAVLLFHPGSPIVQLISDAGLRRVLMGLAMGSTGVMLTYSPWGKQSGAHFNPAVTLTFLRLGRVAAVDAIAYMASQVAGAVAGVAVMALVLQPWIADPAVNYVVTVPGTAGALIAWVTEFTISAILMTVVLVVSNTPRFARWTGLCAGVLVATNIALVSPLSGMSMNPARTLASAVPAGVWTAMWVYLTAPPLGMLVAAECYRRTRGEQGISCAKLHHQNRSRCIFCEMRAARRHPQPDAGNRGTREASKGV
jgi:aquaporin Z